MRAVLQDELSMVAGGIDSDEDDGNTCEYTTQTFDDGSTITYDCNGDVVGATESPADPVDTSCYAFGDLMSGLIRNALDNGVARSGLLTAVNALYWAATGGSNMSTGVSAWVQDVIRRGGGCTPQDFTISYGG